MFKQQQTTLKKTITQVFEQIENNYLENNQHLIDSIAAIQQIVKQMFNDSTFKRTPCYQIMKQIYYAELLRLTNVNTPQKKADLNPIDPFLPLSMQRKGIHMTKYPQNRGSVTNDMIERAKTYHPPSSKWNRPKSRMVHKPPPVPPMQQAQFSSNRPTRKQKQRVETKVCEDGEQYMFMLGKHEYVMSNGDIYKIVGQDGEKIGCLGDFSSNKISQQCGLNVDLTLGFDQDGDRIYLDTDSNIYNLEKQMIGVCSSKQIYTK